MTRYPFLSKKLSFSFWQLWITRISYALPAFSLALIGIPVYVFLPKFYTDTIGIDIATVGMILLGVRIFDAVTDPLIGHLSDRLITPWGRRRPFIFTGSLGVILAIYFLFIPPLSPGDDAVFRLGFWLFALFFFWTWVTIPYESLGPEITQDYHERTLLFSVRDGFLILGTLMAAASPQLASWLLETAGVLVSERHKFLVLALFFTPMIFIGSLVCILGVKEKRVGRSTNPPGFFHEFETLFQNRPFLILLAAYTISAIGSNLPATLILYYVAYVLEAKNAELFLFLYFFTGVCFLPLWIFISRKTGKKAAWIIAMLINTGAFAGVFFLGPGDGHIYGILVVVSGIGFGAGLALPSAIQADVIDYDEMMTGRRREGRYIGLWSIAKKLAAALGVGIGLWLLGTAGYAPNTPQSPEVVTMLRLLYALVPCLCNAMAIFILFFYPLTQARHEEIRRTIDARNRESSPTN